MKCIPVKELNSRAADPQELVLQSENAYADQISTAAERIYNERSERPVVLISGPSGSGKTTTAGRMARLLEDNGCRAHVISMDNYFLSLSEDEIRLAEQGKFDFESPRRSCSASTSKCSRAVSRWKFRRSTLRSRSAVPE